MAVPELMPMNILAWTSEEYHGERYMGPIAKLPLPEWKAKVRGKVRCEILHSQCLGVTLNSIVRHFFLESWDEWHHGSWSLEFPNLRFQPTWLGSNFWWISGSCKMVVDLGGCCFFPTHTKKHTFVKRSQTWKASPQSPSETKKNTWFPPKHTNHGPMPSSWEELTHFWSWESTRWYKSWQLSLLDVFLWDLLNTRPRWIFPSLVGKIPNIFLKRRLYNDRWVPF